MQARSERLLQSYEQIHGPKLPTVGMARELKVEAQSDSRQRTAWLVRQQQPQRRANRRAQNRRMGAAAVADVGAAARLGLVPTWSWSTVSA